jgi:integrase
VLTAGKHSADGGETAGVPWAGLHTLRHTCATMLFRNGWNAVQVQTFLGHHSPAFTLAVYVHLLPDDLSEPSFLDALTAKSGRWLSDETHMPRQTTSRARARP